MAKINKNHLYKYKIKQKVDFLPYHESLKARRMLPRMLDINKRTFEKYMYTAIDDRYEMPAGHLAMLAQYFGCSMEELFTKPPQLITFKPMVCNDKNKLATELGLKK